ncbi:bifunctional [glutamine synthetase] adenylyltransferase/[glutamine synthetase]-adenylyl-L-tyrosine phosphorylase [Buchananella hordeovulneris]|uniref:bifunctional [glutamine synthetase] adenylyltransferase/[glutamine synthetase]-adenylyl-L-tyrosine phosphorylase n=1 Tax=Buchananella hordeovulneris TaxID=52770 RepID=UPI0026DC7A62|nr:bifunctional [glutamine synthetase] adenylyltransferase/[glutamine synthetase]-adenylyl-L-tyrosine phosphorylase [Buchananella hordeovulneris]MDO5081168.1 bifunctional [glutamine synthetase] adenylyltransferase/[glutamine synthetase]-adenylyl-L-tyrosine phosphorylase [Buchananella hordeovulneris]
MSVRSASPTARLLAAGFLDTTRAARLLADPALAVLEVSSAAVVAELADTADPDQALLALLRLLSVLPAAELAQLRAAWQTQSAGPLCQLLGASAALGDHLVRHPTDVGEVLQARPWPSLLAEVAEAWRAATPSGASPGGMAQATACLRRAYRRALLHIAVGDLTAPDPRAHMPQVGRQMAALVDAALRGALAIARAEVDPAQQIRLAIIALGKTGAQELNYISDVDVMFVVAPAGTETSEDDTVRLGTRLATTIAKIVGGVGPEPELWQLDANLRPEGKNGALVRTLDSYARYYRRWAQSWEFQALLKARHVAGDSELGADFIDLVTPLVWQAAEREGFVDSARAMRQRVETLLPAQAADREIKLGAGGLRDVEFTVQLLQLVHGRAAPVHAPDTLTALRQLAGHGFIGRAPAAELATAYQTLRLLEHRIQLHRLRRTHLLPTRPEDLRRLARGINLATDADVENLWTVTRSRVRALHEEIFYRPLLPATAQLTAADLSLEATAAQARLAAIGYRDPRGALHHLRALTDGVSRRATIQRQLLPVMLGWFADCVSPDQGLLAFRQLSEAAGETSWYLRLLRDSSVAARRLCTVLATSLYVAQALPRLPEAVQWLDTDDLQLRSPAQLAEETTALLARHDQAEDAALAVRAVRRRELTRAALADVLQGVDPERARTIIAPCLEAAVRGAFAIALREIAAPRARHLVVGMGRFGGGESSYASDADVMHVFEPLAGVAEEEAAQEAITLATRVRELLGFVGPEPGVVVDAALRPEGKNGPLARSLASYRDYYTNWAAAWERQALLRARPVAGEAELAAEFVEMIDPVRYPAGGLPEQERRAIKRLKARMETERLPRGVQPARHVKLGPGGLTDVEWTVQLLQLDYAHQVPSLRRQDTLGALTAAQAAGIVEAAVADELARAWRAASRVRAARVLATGRVSGTKLDVVPPPGRELTELAVLLGHSPPNAQAAVEDYLRRARHARRLVEEHFLARPAPA